MTQNMPLQGLSEEGMGILITKGLDEHKEREKLLNRGLEGQTTPLEARGREDGPETQQRQCKLTDSHETDSSRNTEKMLRRWICVNSGLWLECGVKDTMWQHHPHYTSQECGTYVKLTSTLHYT